MEQLTDMTVVIAGVVLRIGSDASGTAAAAGNIPLLHARESAPITVRR